jgi:predicted enzyme related to lactoylglutathione lyase
MCASIEKESMMKQVIDWFEIPVRDLARAQAFYEAVLQTPLQREDYAGPNMQMAVLAGEGDVVKGALMAGNSVLQVGASGTLVYLHAGASLDAALLRVVGAGGQVAMGKVALPEGLGFMAHMLDVDGNRVGLHASA